MFRDSVVEIVHSSGEFYGFSLQRLSSYEKHDRKCEKPTTSNEDTLIAMLDQMGDT